MPTRFQLDPILNSAPVGIAVFDYDGLFEAVNPAYCAIYGYQADELLGASITSIFPPEMQERVLALHRKFLDEGAALGGEWEVVRRDKTRLHVISHSVLVVNEAAERYRFVYVTDISERRRMEQKAQHFQALVQSSDDAIISKSLEGIVTSWNAGAEAVFGFSEQEMVGQPIALLIPTERTDEENDILARLTRGEKVRHFETVRLRKDGSSIHVSVTISPILNQQGVVVGASKIARDITPLLQYRAQLEHVARHDPLTDLPNRHLFSDRLQQALVLARRQKLVLAIVYIDLDGFKHINDNFGHLAGDALLVTVSTRIKDTLREVDTLARLGGDEFAAVLVDVQGLEECKELIQRVLWVCAEPVLLGGRVARVSASIGLTLYPMDDATPEDLLAHADQAMYRAKKAGKNQYSVFEPAARPLPLTAGTSASRV
jgi:diguanylate cyclase (GGDEF)-like protein/PAS domain S-box-containing protein